MRKKIAAKLRGRAGESLSETLIALLISALALIMLAGAVSAAGNMVTRSKEAMDEYLAADAKLADRTANSSSGSVTLTVDGENSTYQVVKYANSKADTVVAYNLQVNAITYGH